MGDRPNIGLCPIPRRPWSQPRAFVFSACRMRAVPTAAPRPGELSGRSSSPRASRRAGQKSADSGGHQHLASSRGKAPSASWRAGVVCLWFSDPATSNPRGFKGGGGSGGTKTRQTRAYAPPWELTCDTTIQLLPEQQRRDLLGRGAQLCHASIITSTASTRLKSSPSSASVRASETCSRRAARSSAPARFTRSRRDWLWPSSIAQ